MRRTVRSSANYWTLARRHRQAMTALLAHQTRIGRLSWLPLQPAWRASQLHLVSGRPLRTPPVPRARFLAAFPPRILNTVRQCRWGLERDNVALSDVVADAEMQTSCRRCLSPAAGMFGKDYSAGAPLGLGRPNSTDCAPFSTTIERKPIPCTRQPSFSCPTRSRDIASVLAP
jgi:hypothetical protein